MPYSTTCNTPLSNFEAGLNYKDVSDPAVMVSFPLVDDPDGAAMVAWTTTPWTLPRLVVADTALDTEAREVINSCEPPELWGRSLGSPAQLPAA